MFSGRGLFVAVNLVFALRVTLVRLKQHVTSMASHAHISHTDLITFTYHLSFCRVPHEDVGTVEGFPCEAPNASG